MTATPDPGTEITTDQWVTVGSDWVEGSAALECGRSECMRSDPSSGAVHMWTEPLGLCSPEYVLERANAHRATHTQETQ